MSLLTRFKDKERAVETSLPENSIAVIRLDGKAFHTFTKNFKRPYDEDFASTMDAVGAHLCEIISGSMFAYVQSDEISVVFSDLAKEDTQMWLGGRVQKLASIASSNATAKYMRTSPTEMFPIFDARIHTLTDMEEVKDYVVWRRADATKNAVTMAANTLFSHKFLDKKTTKERQALLVGTELEVLPEDFLYGRLITKEYFDETVEFTHKRTLETHVVPVRRGRWVAEAATDAALTKIVHPTEMKRD